MKTAKSNETIGVETKNKTILVIDDEADYRMMLRERLQANGYGVLEAGDSFAYMELIRFNKFNLILLDIMLPKMNGFELAKLIKRHRPQIPLIILTALTGENYKKIGLLVGADAYLTKPCDFCLLLNKISAFLKDKQSN